jgi:hypothetical protein
MVQNINGWTDDFSEFREKVEPMFGSLEILAQENPDVYAHLVLSHGFMEYSGVKGLYKGVKEEVAGSEDNFHEIVNGPETDQKKKMYEQYHGLMKERYMAWARENNLPEELLEQGWIEYLND